MGEAIVKRLREAGATVMTTARSKPANRDLPDLFIEADISTRDGVQKVVDGVLARLGGIDILVNNVGGSSAPSGGVLALSDDDWQQTFNTNLFGAVRLDHAFLPKMLEQKSGVIIHISSIQRTLPLYDATLAYAAAKAALQQGAFERSRTERSTREHGCPGFHRNGSSGRPDQAIGRKCRYGS